MPIVAFLILVASVPAPASATAATCGPTKFTLGKPAQAQVPARPPKPEAAPKVATTKPRTEAAKAKPKPLADCDKSKKG